LDREDVKRRVQQSTDIVRLIGEHVALKPAGREHLGVCPFHDDSNPSMHVSPAKQIYKCFACGAGGDCFSFVMDYHKMSFPEALKHLADRAGIELPAFAGRAAAGGEPGDDLPQRMTKANQQAVRFYTKQLNDPQVGRVARDYLARRGISDAMADAFAIGYAPDDWNTLASAVEQNKLDREAFLETGLIGKRNDGGCYDRLRHRLVMPIFDAIGRPIAFGGRILPGSARDDATADAKYLNSPESALFHKSRTLFGLNLAKKPIIDSRTAVIVEGYTDVIACHQAGFTNVVATLGTALTRDHAAELRRFCDRAVLVFDADEAGQKAADRALEVFFAEPIDVAVAILPEAKDPADLLAEPDGPDRWEQAIRHAEDAMTFHHRRVREAFDAAETMTARQRIGEDYLRTLVQLGLRQLEPARRGLVYSQVADLLKLDRGTVDRMVRDLGARQRRPAPAHRPETPEPDADPNALADEAHAELAEHHEPVGAPTPPGRRQAERLIVGCLLADPTLFHAQMADGRELAESICPGDLNHLPTRRLYQTVHDYLVDHDQLEPGDLRAGTDDETLVREAFHLRDEVERICNEDAAEIARRLHAAARRLADFQAEQAYADSLLDAPASPAQEADANDEQTISRMLRAVEHARSHPTAARLPRVSP